MEAIRPPSLRQLARELRAPREVAALLRRLPELRRAPRGDGSPVLVLPGFLAGDASTWPLRALLGKLGHDAHGWRLGLNHGDAPALLPRIVERLEGVVRACDRPVALVGWSLGGFLAREVARDRPELVQRVITMGSPVIGGARHTAVAPLFALRWDLDAIAAEVEERSRRPIRRPILAIYSKSDGVVAWQACIDRLNPHVEHVEVEASHAGLGVAPAVLALVAERLAVTASVPSASRLEPAHAGAATTGG